MPSHYDLLKGFRLNHVQDDNPWMALRIYRAMLYSVKHHASLSRATVAAIVSLSLSVHYL